LENAETVDRQTVQRLFTKQPPEHTGPVSIFEQSTVVRWVKDFVDAHTEAVAHAESQRAVAVDSIRGSLLYAFKPHFWIQSA
jgi:hypothetical protein